MARSRSEPGRQPAADRPRRTVRPRALHRGADVPAATGRACATGSDAGCALSAPLHEGAERYYKERGWLK